MSSTYNKTNGGCGDNTPTRDGIVTGTSGNDFMDTSYVDRDGDRPDSYDAILPGAAPNDDLIYAKDGNDTVIAGEGADKVYAGNGNDYVDGGTGDDTIFGECGNDTLWGREGQDLIYGGEGADLLKGGAGNDTVYGGDGNDVIYGGDLGPIPEDGADKLEGGDGNDTIYGGTSNDTIIGGNGRESVDGGDGNDLIDTSGGAVDNRCGPDGVPLPDRGYPGLYPADTDPFNDRDTVLGGAGNDTILTGDDNDLIAGGAGNDSIDGGFDDDAITGDAGNDTVIGAEGSDSISGGDGDDLVYGGYGPGVPDAVNIPDDAGDLRPDNGKDMIDGGAGNDTLFGMDDADSIVGGDGDDLIYGGIDNDTIQGGEGANELYGDDGDDLIYAGTSSSVSAASAFQPLAAPAGGQGIVYGGNGNDTIIGTPNSDSLFGGNGNDWIDGVGSNDKIFGGNDQDTLYGGEGEDSVSGDNGNDVVNGGGGRDTLSGGSGDDIMDGGSGDDRMTGDAGNDAMIGGDGQDRMNGGAGNDTLTGGDGVDTMLGGDDRDTFYAGFHDSVDGGTGGDDFDTLDLTGLIPPGGSVELSNVTTDPDGDSISGIAIIRNSSGGEVGRVTFTEIEQCIPCFTPGSLVATPRGEVPVESLKVGDKVITRDNGIQEIRWVGQKDLSWANLVAMPHLKPVLIRQGSLGNGLPERDMMVSPNHRMLVASDRTQLYFDEHEVLVAAKHLVSGNAIHQVDRAGVSYIHFMFDEHQIVLADGAWTESFQPGDYTLKGIGNAQRSEVLELFPDLATEGGLQDYVAARRTLKRHEARLLVR